MKLGALVAVLSTLAVTGISVGDHSPTVAAGAYSGAGADAYVSAKDWNGLLTYAQAWTRTAPKDPDAWLYLGLAYGSKVRQTGLQRPLEAHEAFRHAVTLKPVWPEAWNELGMTAQEIGRYDEAIDALTRATQQAPERAIFWANLASAYITVGKLSLALNALDGMERAARSDVEWYVLGNFWSAFGDPQLWRRAIDAYQRALELNPQFAAAWNEMGTREEMLGNMGVALSDYHRARRLGDTEAANSFDRLYAATDADTGPKVQAECAWIKAHLTGYNAADVRPETVNPWYRAHCM